MSKAQYKLKELQELPPINFNDTKALVADLWLFLTNDKMPNKAIISKEAFCHEVGVMIDSVRANAVQQCKNNGKEG